MYLQRRGHAAMSQDTPVPGSRTAGAGRVAQQPDTRLGGTSSSHKNDWLR
jgi:hypothetical protein